MNNQNKTIQLHSPELTDEQPPSYEEVLSEENRRYVESSRIIQQQQQQQQQQQDYQTSQHEQQYYRYQGPHYQAIPPLHGRIVRSIEVEELNYFPTNAALFLLGFIFPPLWCVGCCCISSRNRHERWWQKWNIAMSVLFIMTLLIFVFVLALLLWDAR